ncbi:MAG: efflux RND transporter periplasmic adaptor subunit [Gemmatimonadales bacterium]|nr:MAG: efflux RND transporter periplasmic adaptor subunit [Gemmatimonadales bacterium]
MNETIMTFEHRNGRRLWLAGALALALGACGDAEAGDAGQTDGGGSAFARIINVAVEPVEPRRFVEEIFLTGVVRANRDVTVSAEEGGTVQEILATKGVWVQEGQPLLRMDAAVLQAQVDQARAAAELARETWERRKRLWEEQGVGAELAYLEARFAAEQSEANLRMLEERLARTVIRAPVEGILEDRMVEVGSLLAPGSPAFRIVDIYPVKVSAGVPERYAPDVAVGSPVRITFDVLPESGVEGRIGFVGVAVDPRNRTFPVEIRLPNREGRIKPEMVADVSLQRRALEEAVVVPQDALVRTTEGYIVFVAEGEGDQAMARARAVELGPSAANQVVVTTGLEKGDRLIVLGQKSVADGDRIRVVEGR